MDSLTCRKDLQCLCSLYLAVGSQHIFGIHFQNPPFLVQNSEIVINYLWSIMELSDTVVNERHGYELELEDLQRVKFHYETAFYATSSSSAVTILTLCVFN